MSFHPDKGQILTISKKRNPISHNYTLHGHTLEHVTSAKYLDCTLNNHLDWGQHKQNICNKANRTISFLRRNLNISSTSTKETAYKALVRPTVDHASTVWDPHEKGDIHRLDMVQRQAARYVKNKYHNRSSVTDMLADLQWKPLQERRKEARLIMLYKVINNKIALDNSQLIPLNSTSTRNTHDLSYQIPYCRTQYRQQSFPLTIKDWNSLYQDAMSAGTVESFRTHLTHTFNCTLVRF